MGGPDPNSFYGNVRSSRDVPDLLQTGMNLLRLAAASVGVVAIIVGLILAYSVFGIVRGMVAEPQTLTHFLDVWELNMRGPDSETVPESATLSADDTLGPETVPSGEPGPAEESGVLPAPSAAGKTASATSDAGTPKPVRVKPKRPMPPPRDPSTWEVLREILLALRTGAFARAVGAFFFLMLILVLVRIPFSIMVTGTRVLHWLASSRTIKPPPL